MARDRLAAMRAQQGNQGGGYGAYGGAQQQPQGGGGSYGNPYSVGGQQQQQGGYGGGYTDDYSQPQQPPMQQQYDQQGGYGQQQGGYGQQQGGYGQQQGGYGAGGYDAPAGGQQQQGGYYGVPPTSAGGNGHQAYEMQPVQPQQQGGQGYGAPGGVGGGPVDQVTFLNEITELQTSIAGIEENINRIADLHSRSLNNMDEASAKHAEQQLNSYSEETRQLTNAVKTRIQVLATKANKLPPSKDKNLQESQLGAVKSRFKATIQRYQEMEQQYRQKYRARAERQFRIVKPDATPQEVQAALGDDAAGGQQIFSQALLNSNRYGEARGALREVQERHEDIKKIERTIAELAQLFNEVDILLTEQDDQLNVITGHAAAVETDMKTGLEATNKAVVSARKARKKRICCFWLMVIILLVIAAIIVIAICTQGERCKGKSSSPPAQRRRSFIPAQPAFLLEEDDSLVSAQKRMAAAFGDYL